MDTTRFVRDARNTFHFWVPDCLIDHFGATIGPYGIAIYNALARRTTQGSCYPGIKRLAHETGMSTRKAHETVHTLAAVGLIAIEKRTDEWGDPDTNRYILLDVSGFDTKQRAYPAEGTAPHAVPHAPDTGGVLQEVQEGTAPHADKVVPLEVVPHGSSISPEEKVEVPKNEEGPAKTQKGRTRGKDRPFPIDQEAQDALRAEVLTPDILAFASAHGLLRSPGEHFERFLWHGVAHQRTLKDFRAGFRQWLLNPLAKQYDQAAANDDPRTAQAKRERQEAAAKAVREADARAVAERNNPVAQAEADQARQEAMAQLGSIFGPNWRAVV